MRNHCLILLLAILLLFITNIGYAQRVRLEVRVNWLESKADDGLAETRHRWAFKVKGFDDTWSECTGFGADGGDYKELYYTNNVFYSKNFNDLKESITMPH